MKTPDVAGLPVSRVSEMVDSMLGAMDVAGLELLREALARDGRAGMAALARRISRSVEALACDRKRFEARLEFEKPVRDRGFRIIAGIDEAGRGPLAGPVVAGAVVLDPCVYIPGLDDSKRLSPLQRERVFDMIVERCACHAVGVCTPREIDLHNIYQATVMAMEAALAGLRVRPDFVITDAVRLPRAGIPQLPVIKGDSKFNCVAAASIVAKVTRDRMMLELDREFPGYGFARHKGYATAEHLEALRRLGPSPCHRTSFHWESGQEMLPGLEGTSSASGR